MERGVPASHSDGPGFTSWLHILTVMPASLSTSVLIHEKHSTHTQVFASMKSASIWEALGTLPNLDGLKAPGLVLCGRLTPRGDVSAGFAQNHVSPCILLFFLLPAYFLCVLGFIGLVPFYC